MGPSGRSRVVAALPYAWRALVLAAALGAGIYLSLRLLPRPAVGVIAVRGTLSPSRSQDVLSMLAFARDSAVIRAVVLLIDSPGGEATISQELYLSTTELAGRKPVVAAIGQVGASGAYHLAVAAWPIYVQPASLVGSIGVIASVPEPVALREDRLTTGPLKGGTAKHREFVRMLELLRRSFVEVVVAHRGEALKLRPEELSSGRVFLGIEAVQLGLADAIGTRGDAVAKAAKLAGLRRYSAVDVAELLDKPSTANVLWVNTEELFAPSNTTPSYYFLYLNAE